MDFGIKFYYWFFEDDTDKHYFIIGFILIFCCDIAIGFFTYFRFIIPFLIISIIVWPIVFYLYKRVAGASSGLYHSGSKETDYKALLKGMYGRAVGLKNLSKYDEVEETYKEILSDYPDELDAKLLLGQLYEEHLNNPNKAYDEYLALRKKIIKDNINYEYNEVLRENIKRLRNLLSASS